MPPPGSSGLELATGLALALAKFRLNARDAAAFNARLLGRDKAILLLFLLSGASFALSTESEARSLKRELRAAAKAPRAAVSAPDKQLAKVRPKTTFWRDLRFLVSLGLFPGGKPMNRGGALLATQLSLLLMRTVLTVKATQTNAYLLTRAIAQGSWSVWSRWVVSFMLWGAGATPSLVACGALLLPDVACRRDGCQLGPEAHRGVDRYRAAQRPDPRGARQVPHRCVLLSAKQAAPLL